MIRSAVRFRSSAPTVGIGTPMRVLCVSWWMVCCGVLSTAWAAPVRGEHALVEYDRGEKQGERVFASAARCVVKPCVVTQHGAVRFDPTVAKHFRVEALYIHDGSARPISLFQQSTTLEQKLGERLLNRTPNRKIVNLTRLVESGAANTIYMYGILLQYDVDEGDPMLIRLTNLQDARAVQEYYFRFHKTGPRPDLDLAFIFPVSHFKPNPGDAIRSASRGMAFSFSVGSHMDPERKYHLLSKLTRAIRLNLVFGVVDRQIASDIAGDAVISNSVDGFGGLGVTFFDFLLTGYGYNLFRAPRGGFPFMGLEIRHVFQFIKALKKDTHSKWEEYLEAETHRALPARDAAPPTGPDRRGSRFCRGAHIDRACSIGAASGGGIQSSGAQ